MVLTIIFIERNGRLAVVQVCFKQATVGVYVCRPVLRSFELLSSFKQVTSKPKLAEDNDEFT